MDAGELIHSDSSSAPEAFSFDLPRERIALRPASPRSAARLLVVTPDALRDRRVCDLPDLLEADDLLVVNDTKVLAARLRGIRRRRDGAASVEVTLLRDLGEGLWAVLARPLRRLRAGDRIEFADGFRAPVEEVGDAQAKLRFDLSGDDLLAAIDRHGRMPLPPYIGRHPDRRDREDYQTTFARNPGAVAAPTAGLHFDAELLGRLDRAGVRRAPVTLHVGGGTFRPVRGGDMEDHRLDPEWGAVPASTAAAIRRARRVVAVGTTTLRLMETAAAAGNWPAPWSGEAELFLRPGHRFLTAGALLTNFHLPRSTLFMLVCAFCGTLRMREAYRHAIESGYRFYSYGDACLLLPGETGGARGE